MKIASWNVEGRLGGWSKKGRGTAEHILEGIKKLDADIIIVPEAYLDEPAHSVRKKIKMLGYEILDVAYDDYGRENEKYMRGILHLWILSRVPVEEVGYPRWGDVRTLITCVVREPSTSRRVRILATHLDDRSEASRQKQIKEIIPFINNSKMPTVMIGDFNALWLRGKNRLLHMPVVRCAARYFPHAYMRGIILRLIEMAQGTILRDLISNTRMRPVDTRYRATATPKIRGILFMPSIRMVQIDHIFISPDIQASDFKVERDGGADHRAISATIKLTN